MSSPRSFVSVELGWWESNLAKSQSKEVYVEQKSELRVWLALFGPPSTWEAEREMFLNWIELQRVVLCFDDDGGFKFSGKAGNSLDDRLR